MFFVHGGNGSGKTTLLKTCAGLISPAKGKVTLHTKLDYLGHENALHLELTLDENLSFWEKLTGRKFANELLLYFNLMDLKRLPLKCLSFGQRRKVALGRVLLASDAKLLLLDEPFQGLDQGAQAAAAALMRGKIKKGVAFVISTHKAAEDGEHFICLD